MFKVAQMPTEGTTSEILRRLADLLEKEGMDKYTAIAMAIEKIPNDTRGDFSTYEFAPLTLKIVNNDTAVGMFERAKFAMMMTSWDAE